MGLFGRKPRRVGFGAPPAPPSPPRSRPPRPGQPEAMKSNLPLPHLLDRNKMKRRWPLLVFFVLLVLFWSLKILFPT